jgi:nitrous oxide reductase accessory protein NosL
VHAQFDRCSPSILAFRDMKAAQAFVAEHGGQVDRFSAFASAFQR